MIPLGQYLASLDPFGGMNLIFFMLHPVPDANRVTLQSAGMIWGYAVGIHQRNPALRYAHWTVRCFIPVILPEGFEPSLQAYDPGHDHFDTGVKMGKLVDELQGEYVRYVYTLTRP